MFSQFFDHQQLRRYILAFGQFFNNLEVRRNDSNGTETQRLVVPLEYSNKERWLSRLVQDPNFLQGVEGILPRMGYETPTLHYDTSRKLNTIDSLVFPSTDGTTQTRLYVGVPYRLDFELNLLVKIQADGMQIIEQILPYFTPDLTFVMSPMPDVTLPDQIPLTLTSVTSSDNYEGDFSKRRAILWTLGFSMHVYFYGPKRDQKRINEVVVNLYDTDPTANIIDLDTEDSDQIALELNSGAGHLNAETSDAPINPVAIIDTSAAANGTITTTVTETGGVNS